MEARQRRVNVETYAKSAASAVALQKELKFRDDARLPDPSAEECIAICEEADRKAVFGHSYQIDRRTGEPKQDGIGACPHGVTMNSLAAVKRYEGKEAHERLVRRLFKEAPEVAKKLGLELPRVGA